MMLEHNSMVECMVVMDVAMARSKVPEWPYLSGHCNPRHPDELHARCKGEYAGHVCTCPCHWDPVITDAGDWI